MQEIGDCDNTKAIIVYVTDMHCGKAYKPSDIYTVAASAMFGIAIHEVTEEQRRTAKAMLYGSLYNI